VLETAHDMGGEHRLLFALSPTDVPVPRPLLLAGAEVIGAPFYLMTFADGEVHARPAAAGAAGRRGGDRARLTSWSMCWPDSTSRSAAGGPG
jgi:aminoglycoside phosphotransferase (APT) family kinase protein